MNLRQAPGGAAWEAAALDVLEQLGCPPAPIDSFQLAISLGLRIAPTSVPTAMLAGNAVMVSPALSAKSVRWYAAHELGHWVLDRRGLPNCEEGADRIAEAMLLPIYAFDPDSVGWDVAALQQRHMHCSLETIARRILSLRRSCVTVWNGCKLIGRLSSPGTKRDVVRVTAFERCLAIAAQRLGGVVRAGSQLVGFVDDDNPKRAITLCAADELLRRSSVRPRPIQIK